MTKLKKEGREYTISHGDRANYYPAKTLPPLVDWQKDITKTGGYKAAAHHCIALKCISNHSISGELKDAGYDPNNGRNCSWLPYSKLQFSRARAYAMPLQKHRGGHTAAYFGKVSKHIDEISNLIEDKFCLEEQTPDKKTLLQYIGRKEDKIWKGIADPDQNAYHLYNTSYLDPTKPWGYPFPGHNFEVGKSQLDVIGIPTPVADDEAAEKESEMDPE
jgi:hypothetical protein